MDLIATVDRIPVAGESRVGRGFVALPGGKAGNQAAQVAKSGIQSFILGRIGNDLFGDMLQSDLDVAGIDTTYLIQDESHPTGVSTVLVREGGEYASVIVPGAAEHLGPADIAGARPAFEAVSLLLLQLEIPTETSLVAARAARTHGAQVVLNAAPLSAANLRTVQPLLATTDILVVNAAELAAIAAVDPTTMDPEETAMSLLSPHVRPNIVVVTLGAKGVIALSREETVSVSAHRVVVVDTLGAGDAFLGAFAAALAHGERLREAVHYGTVAGTLTVTKPGALAGQPNHNEIIARM